MTAQPAAVPEATAPEPRPSGGIALVCMPWATTTRPSLALGILTRIGRTAGLTVHVHYPNLDLVAAIGFARGAAFAHRQALSGLAEHLFACDLFGAHALDSDAVLALSAGRDLPEGLADPEVLRELR
ncbi:MAG: hypothetical protein P8Z68_06285, partial [Kineosporiaceae bacterium]